MINDLSIHFKLENELEAKDKVSDEAIAKLEDKITVLKRKLMLALEGRCYYKALYKKLKLIGKG